MDVGMKQDHRYEMWRWVMDIYFAEIRASQLILKLKEQLVSDLGPRGPIKQTKVEIFDFGQIPLKRK